MKMNVKITEDNTGNQFGVEGYQVELSTNLGTINAFINVRNIVTTEPSAWLHGLFKKAPFTSEYVELCDSAVQKAFKNWNRKVELIEVMI